MPIKNVPIDLDDPVRNEEVYEAILRVRSIVMGAQMLADHHPDLQGRDSAPIAHLLYVAVTDLHALAERTSP